MIFTYSTGCSDFRGLAPAIVLKILLNYPEMVFGNRILII